ncbi:DUF2189 domain-containing protein [Yunchengibacter salinarum]|uniref:DUF2189 domain-containing protein n=1 Tax=Yunchengibacter salinarum TaxID=3133399 RepID=UPI0035B5E010
MAERTLDTDSVTTAESERQRREKPSIINTLNEKDLRDAFAAGLADFRASPSFAVVLGLLYPVVALIMTRFALGYDTLTLIFPLAAGFVLVGPVAATAFYEISRRRETGEPIGPGVITRLKGHTVRSVAAVGGVLLVIFTSWLIAALFIAKATIGSVGADSVSAFLGAVFTTPAGWAMIVVGNLVGFLFALLVLAIGALSVPMLVDRDVGTATALTTSMSVCRKNKRVMAKWGLFVTAALMAGSIPLFFGLTAVLPILGHATWHLYRRAVSF